jgi:hypothetical protein
MKHQWFLHINMNKTSLNLMLHQLASELARFIPTINNEGTKEILLPSLNGCRL